MKITGLPTSDIYRTQHVIRWHILKSWKRQTVAEHSFMVAIISVSLMDKLKINDDHQRRQIMEYALVHDVPEVIMGDAVSPVKKAAKDTFSLIEYAIDPIGMTFRNTLPKFAKAVVKLADYIDAMKYLVEETKGIQASKIYNKLYKEFEELIEVLTVEEPSFNWSSCHEALREIMSEAETFIDDLL